MTGFSAVRRIVRRMQLTRGKVAVVAAVTAALTLAAVATNIGDGGRRAVAGVVTEVAFLIAVPITSLVFAAAVLGAPRDDGTLVYLWLRPVRRTVLAGGAVAAALDVVLPANLALVVAVTLGGGQPGLLPAAAIAVALSSLAYVGVFVGLGLRTSRSLLWGLGYVLLVEGFAARFSEPLAALSVRRYATSVFSQVASVPNRFHEVSTLTAVAMLVVLAAVGYALAVRWLVSRDVD